VDICNDYEKVVAARQQSGAKQKLKLFAAKLKVSDKWAEKIKRLEQLRRELEVRSLEKHAS
jgi:hypothetical protein